MPPWMATLVEVKEKIYSKKWEERSFGLRRLAASMNLITTAAALFLCSPSALQSIQFHTDILGLILWNENFDWFRGVLCFAIAQDSFLETEGNVIMLLVVPR